MDIFDLNTKAVAEKGAFLHLKHPKTNKPMWNGEGEGRTAIGVMVRGRESKTVQDRLKKIQKDRVTRNEDPDSDDGMEYLLSLVFEIIGLEDKGVPLDGSVERDVRTFFGLSDSFAKQVVDFAAQGDDFFAAAATV